MKFKFDTYVKKKKKCQIPTHPFFFKIYLSQKEKATHQKKRKNENLGGDK